ncbi:MAG: hypothetical protein KDA25_03550, partial [Phycisphaerales bacterium]|nr:hypothetical protein [Phycisphaerales bacterium]
MTFREARPGSHLFTTTRRSLIQDLDSNDPAVVRSALEELSRIYRPVVERCFARCGAWNHADVEDAAQEFFEVIVLERHLFAKAAPGRGRLRALLWTAIRHFRIDRLRRTATPRTEILPADDDGLLVEAQDVFERD